MKILVTGADGMLGAAVVDGSPAGTKCVGVDLPDGDLSDPAAVAEAGRRRVARSGSSTARPGPTWTGPKPTGRGAGGQRRRPPPTGRRLCGTRLRV